MGSQSRRRRPSGTSCSADSHEKIRGISRRQPLRRRLKSLWLGERIQQGDYFPPIVGCYRALQGGDEARCERRGDASSRLFFKILGLFPYFPSFPISYYCLSRHAHPISAMAAARQGRGQPYRPTARRNPHHRRHHYHHYHHCHARHHIFIFTYTALGRCSHAQRLPTPPVLCCLLGAAAER